MLDGPSRADPAEDRRDGARRGQRPAPELVDVMPHRSVASQNWPRKKWNSIAATAK